MSSVHEVSNIRAIGAIRKETSARSQPLTFSRSSSTFCFSSYFSLSLPPSIKKAKEKGRDAYKEENWESAINYFTEAMKDDSDAPCLALRSSAYQKMGKLAEALADADKCTELDSSYARGHFRRACVFSAMKESEKEIEAYQKGLELCPDDKSLKKGLEIAQRVKTASTKAQHAANATMATLEAANSRSNKANSAKDISSFVTQTKWNLELQMRALQSKLDLVKELGEMTSDAKLDLLYNILLEDTETSKNIPTSKITEALKSASSSLIFSADVASAVDSVQAPSDVLKRADFQAYCQALVAKMNTNVNDFSEFVVYQVKFGSNNDSAPAPVDAPDKPSNILNDNRMMALFVMFDKDGDSTVDFKEVAIGLYKLTHNLEDSAKNAAALLLMMDNNDERVLTYETFAKLIMSVAATSNMSFDELADQLTLALTDKTELSEQIMNEIMVIEENLEKIQDAQAEETERKKTLDALSYSKTQRLFELLDANGDGSIDFQELYTGLRKYHKAAKTSSSNVEGDALMIIGHDKDSNQSLDKEEFAYAIANYADALKTPLHELIDFMCVVCSQEASVVEEYEARYTEMSTFKRSRQPRRQSLGVIVDIGEGDEEEEEEDDW